MPEPLSGRDARYRRQLERVANQRDHYQRCAIDAVAALLLATGDHLDLLEGDDLAAVLVRAQELRGKMVGRSR
ncbi:hypothetical protein GCM10009789_54120 [Kribbella sancticallisti]|uniref:Uncharacterized protein n=1 Tax=Kribbella sancticallisti TaxID=460087 RepID=A0ABN2E3E9_9ACTN